MIEAHKQQLGQFEQPYSTPAGVLKHEVELNPVKLTVENAVAELDASAERYEQLAAWPASVVETDNPNVINGEVQIVDANTAEAPHYNVYFNLHNWAEQFTVAPEKGAVDTDFAWESKRDHQMVSDYNGTVQKSRALMLGNNKLSFIYDVDKNTFDNLVCLSVPKGEGVPLARAADVEMAISEALVLLTGAGLDVKPGNMSNADMVGAVKEYHQDAPGPLTESERAELHQNVRRTRVTQSHVAYVDKSESGALSEKYKFSHKVKSIQDVEEVIAAGELQSSLQRLKQGDTRFPNRADMAYGGGDMVYTHLFQSEEIASHDPKPVFILKNSLSHRLDVRAYSDDAYGQVDLTVQSPVGAAIGREVSDVGAYATEARKHPKDAEELRGVHEVDFQNSIATADVETIYLPNPHDSDTKEPDSSFNDFKWFRIINTSFYERGIDVMDSVPAMRAEKDIRSRWGDPDAVKEYLTGFLKLDDMYASLIVEGMNMEPKERLIGRLHLRGIKDIGGRPLEDIIQYGSTLSEVRQAFQKGKPADS